VEQGAFIVIQNEKTHHFEHARIVFRQGKRFVLGQKSPRKSRKK